MKVTVNDTIHIDIREIRNQVCVYISRENEVQGLGDNFRFPNLETPELISPDP